MSQIRIAADTADARANADVIVRFFVEVLATGRPVRVSFSDLYRLRDARITEHWHNFDEAGLMRQLGAA